MSKLGGPLKQDHHFTQPTLKVQLINHLDISDSQNYT